MRIAITGASGLLGTTLIPQIVAHRYTPIAGVHKNPIKLDVEQHPLDLNSRDSVSRFIEISRPDWIIHAAAETDVDLCEREPARAIMLNQRATELVCEAAARRSIRVLYISTDYVFGGQAGPYSEADAINPINEYGRTKLGGELAVRTGGAQNLIVRSASFLGRASSGHMTFAERMLLTMRDNPPLEAARDQCSNATPVEDLAEGILELVENDYKGTWHVAHPDLMSRDDLARLLAEIAGLPQSVVKSVAYIELKRSALRPLNGGLDVRKFLAATNFQFTPLEVALKKLVTAPALR